MTFLTHIPFRLTAISPIHIGNGEEIDWVTSIADDQALHIFDIGNLKLPESLSRRIEELSLNCRNENGLLRLQQLYKQNKQIFLEQATEKIAMPPGLAGEFAAKLGHNVRKNQSGNKVINQLNISRTAHAGKLQKAVIPGSSLKGAIRTAWLSSLADRRHVQGHGKAIKLDEKTVLGGDFATDPFRLFKVDDSLSSQAKATQVFYLANPKRNPEKEKTRKAKGPPQRLEAITPFAYGEFSGAFRINDLQGKGQVESPPIGELIRAVNNYNLALFNAQAGQWQGLPSIDKTWLKTTRALIAQMDRNTCMLVRLGRLATAESKTVGHELQEIFIPQMGKSLKHATTFWLAGDYNSKKNLLPMGWAVIEIEDHKSTVLKNFCQLMKQQPGSAVTPKTDPIPVNPTEAITWIEKTLEQTAGSKEIRGQTVLTLLEQAKKWPGDSIYDLIEIVTKYKYGKYQDRIDDILIDY